MTQQVVFQVNVQQVGAEDVNAQILSMYDNLLQTATAADTFSSNIQDSTVSTNTFTAAIQEQTVALQTTLKALLDTSTASRDASEQMSDNATEARGAAEGFKELAGMLLLTQVSMSALGDEGGAAAQALTQLAGAAFALGSAANAAAAAGIDPMILALGGITAIVAGITTGLVDIGTKAQVMGVDVKAAGDLSNSALASMQSQMLALSANSGVAFDKVDEALTNVMGQLRAFYGAADAATNSATFMNAALELSVTTGEDLNGTAAGLSDTMRAFSISLDDAQNTANLLYQASLDTGMSVEQLGESLSRLAARGGDLANNLPQVVQLLTEMNAQGLNGGRSIQVLTSALEKINEPTAQFDTLMKQLGIDTNNYMSLDLNGRIDTIAAAYEHANPQQQQWIADTVAGTTDAGLFQKALEELTSGGFDNEQDALNEVNKLQDDYNDKQNTAAGRAEILKTQVMSLAEAIGQDLAIGLIVVGDLLNSFGEQVHDTIIGIGSIASALGALAHGVEDTAQSLADFADKNFAGAASEAQDATAELGATGQAFSDLGSAAKDYSTISANALSDAIADAQGIANAMNSASDAGKENKSATSDLSDAMDTQSTSALADAQSVNQLTENEQAYGKTIGENKDRLNDYLTAIANASTPDALNTAEDSAEKAIDSLASDIDTKVGGGAGEAWKTALNAQLAALPSTLSSSELASQMSDIINTAYQSATDQFSSSLDSSASSSRGSSGGGGSTTHPLATSVLGTPDDWGDIADSDAQAAIDKLNESFAQGETADPAVGTAVMKVINEGIKNGLLDTDAANDLKTQFSDLVQAALAGDSDAAAEFTSKMVDLGTAIAAQDAANKQATESAAAWNEYADQGATLSKNYSDKITQLSQDIDQLSASEQDASTKEIASEEEADNIATIKTNIDAAVQSWKDMQSEEEEVAKWQQDINDLATQQADAQDKLNQSQADQQKDAQQSYNDRSADLATTHAQKLQDIQENSSDKTKAADIQKENERYANETANLSTSHTQQMRDMAEKDQQAQADLATQQQQARDAAATKRQDEINQMATRQADAAAEVTYRQTLEEALGNSATDIENRAHTLKLANIRDEADLRIAEDQRAEDAALQTKIQTQLESIDNDIATGKLSELDPKTLAEISNLKGQLFSAQSAIGNDQSNINAVNARSAADQAAGQTPTFSQSALTSAESTANSAAQSTYSSTYQGVLDAFKAAGAGGLTAPGQAGPSVSSTQQQGGLSNLPAPAVTPSSNVGHAATPTGNTPPAAAGATQSNMALSITIVTTDGKTLGTQLLKDKDFQNGEYTIIVDKLTAGASSSSSMPAPTGAYSN